jgi:hypothetical protein
MQSIPASAAAIYALSSTRHAATAPRGICPDYTSGCNTGAGGDFRVGIGSVHFSSASVAPDWHDGAEASGPEGGDTRMAKQQSNKGGSRQGSQTQRRQGGQSGQGSNRSEREEE